MLSYRGDFPAQQYNELVLGVTEAAPTALILPVKVISIEFVSKGFMKGFHGSLRKVINDLYISLGSFLPYKCGFHCS